MNVISIDNGRRCWRCGKSKGKGWLMVVDNVISGLKVQIHSACWESGDTDEMIAAVEPDAEGSNVPV